MRCGCFIVPQDVLERLSADSELSEEARQANAYTAAISERVRVVRKEQAALSLAVMQFPALAAVSLPKVHTLPAGVCYDCHHGTTLPGALVSNPLSSSDATVRRAYTEAEAVAKFYWDVFKRDSVDDHHMTLVSSVHYANRFNNAFWNGTQMVFGDGDAQTFVDFTAGNDVIGHELTHGVTQHSAGFGYADEPGGLNESMSDVFGSMFRQWQAGQDVNTADWLIGRDIMGPLAKSKGYTCLRDMANPGAAHALAPQPAHFNQYHAGMDPHYSSGIPNFAFYKAAIGIGGKSWEKAGQVWYRALTAFPPNPNMLMKDFADRTRTLATSMYQADASIHNAIHAAWIAVGL